MEGAFHEDSTEDESAELFSEMAAVSAAVMITEIAGAGPDTGISEGGIYAAEALGIPKTFDPITALRTE
jgi:hypothetical protein